MKNYGYGYTVFVNGIEYKRTGSYFKPNIIAEMVKDLDLINPKIDEIVFKVVKKKDW